MRHNKTKDEAQEKSKYLLLNKSGDNLYHNEQDNYKKKKKKNTNLTPSTPMENYQAQVDSYPVVCPYSTPKIACTAYQPPKNRTEKNIT